MDEADERVLKILDEFARAPREVGPLALSEEYLAAVARVESLPESRSGTNKSWVHQAIRNSRRMYARAVRKR